MSILVATALGAASATLPSCSWDRPGAFAFSGDVVAAVDRYTDIPAPVRAALKRRMEQRQYDEVAVIGRDSIIGKARYSPEIRDMHFASGTVCRSVTRSRWRADAQERGLVYCEAEHCIIVPTVCRNVSRVTRLQKAPTAATPSAPVLGQSPAEGGGGGGAEPSTRTAMAASGAAPEAPLQPSELQFDAPAAGPSFVALADPVTYAAPTFSGGGAGGGNSVPFLGGGGGFGFGGGVVSPPGAGGTSGTGAVPSPSLPPANGGGGTITAPATPAAPGNPDAPVTPTPPVVAEPPSTIVPAPPFELPRDLPILPPGTVSPVPEPSSWAMMVLGSLGLAAAARRRARRADAA